MAKPSKPAEPLTPEQAILDLISALGFDPADISAVEVNPRYTRVLRKDRSLRSVRVDWQPKPKEAS